MLAWALAGATLLILAGWPIVARMTASADDIAVLIRAENQADTVETLKAAWGGWRFRPTEAFGFLLVDPLTRDARAVMWLQVPGMLAIVGALAVVLRRLGIREPTILPMALAWWGMSVGSFISLWRAGAISQTWSAAEGVWLLIAAWVGCDRAKAGHMPVKQMLAVTSLCILGVLTKLTFLGWCGGALFLVGLSYVSARREDRSGRSHQWLLLLLPLVLIPAAFLCVRMLSGGLDSVFTLESERYRVRLGANVGVNLAVAALGFLTVGPAHLVRSPQAIWVLRAMPLVAALLTTLIIVWPWVYARIVGNPGAAPVSCRRALVILVLAFSGASTALPLGRVSELYLMGPNVGAAVLVGAGLAFVAGRGRAAESRQSGVRKIAEMRVVAASVILAVMGIGAVGLVSRCCHFAITWTYSRELNARLVDSQANLPTGVPPALVLFDQGCVEGYFHSVYVGPPARALNVPETERALNLRHPERSVRLVEWSDAEPSPDAYLVLDCSDLPPRPRW
ncbi:MAG: hypothetical protein ACYS0G_12715 [Planctomycetota bacterium]|jgi:hypothetical protein